MTLEQFAALTGPSAQLGLRMQTGNKAQFDAVNKAGGNARDQRRQSALDCDLLPIFLPVTNL